LLLLVTCWTLLAGCKLQRQWTGDAKVLVEYGGGG
jgi:hypothetical protein